ncbi:LysR substrate-binding domain-containing protein [Thalassotalea ponticola]|uniref:LysR family transcriptional regulator n=1 Tax=Thalassotalea ponticola TaxID=1523392 RepID=UPI0025B4CBF3|nr:LysR family transcriptional regulator [Thalassotalea ponticola]MDN3652362.1 LysR substrate-binding domain-containing protein [Thalassotalea ponticola]
MDIRVFKTFIEVANHRHFGHAANTLFITPAAVSARIKQLESFYNTSLLIRDKNNLRLTEQGEALLAYAYQMVKQLDESKMALKRITNQKPAVYLATTSNVWDAFLNSRMPLLISRFEQFVLSAEISVREAIQRKLLDRSLDVALLTDPISDHEIHCEKLAHFSLSLVGSSAQFSDDVANYVMVDWGLTFAKEHAMHHKLTPCLKTTTAKIAQQYISSNGGFAYLPSELVAEQLNDQSLHLIDTQLQVLRPIYLAYRKDNQNPAFINDFKTCLADECN